MNRVRVGRWMLMSDGIQRYNMFCSPDDRYVNPGGEWVRFTDVEARIRELETQLVDTERRRVAAVEQAEQFRAGMWQVIRNIDRLRDSVAAYRSTGEIAPAPDETGGK